MATLVATTVDPGATGDYTSLDSAEGDHFGGTGSNFVANDEYAVCTLICTNGNADTTNVTVNGRTTDATRDVTIEVSSSYRHAGVWPASGNIYRLDVASNVPLQVADDFTTITGLAIRIDPGGDNTFAFFLSNNDGLVMSDCVITVQNLGSYTGVRGFAFSQPSGDVAKVYNCIAYGFGNSGAWGFDQGDTGTTYLYNCTAVDNEEGFQQRSGTIVAKNCIAFNNTTDYDGTFDSGSTNNGYTNGQSGPTGGSNAVDLGSSGTDLFVDYSGDDFHVKATSNAYQAGADLRTDTYINITDDIDGDTRPATPCIGADEAVSGVTLTVADAAHSQALDALALTQKHTISVNALAHAQALDATVLTQKHTIVVNELLHAQTLDGLVLTQKHTLSVNELSHGNVVDGIGLTQQHTLSINDIAHLNTLDGLSLTQAHTIVVAELSHGHALDSVELSLAITLTVAGLAHAQALDGNLGLTQAHILALANLLHAQALDGMVLTQAHAIVVQDVTHVQTLDLVNFNLPVGAVLVAFTSAKPSMAFTSAKPSVAFSSARPEVTFS